MSDLSKAVHTLEDLISGKTDWDGFADGEAAIIAHRISTAPAALQPLLNLAFGGLKAAASTLVSAGETELGAIIAQSSDTLATELLNAASLAGVPTGTPLNAAEHAALVAIINGFKAMLDRMHLNLAAPPAAPAVAA